MALLSSEQIDSVDDRRYEDVDVPEWGGQVRIMALSGEDRDAYEAAIADAKQSGQGVSLRLANFRSKLVAKAMVDENFKRLYPDSKVKALAKKNAAVIDRLWSKTQELSGMDKSAKDGVEEGKADSETGQSASST
ncbi:hypothetical protein NE857_31615 [Nocardiopsis exhalans]|uniref:Tail assembly chaperone n=1 Tax=Nocardiopsis exhalans TaxID=163604 RepID=A0ABY5D898_9ACTN|nr:hypothetical protein [Nocardiopsis exhalans]USY19728.1 hypothetical protein NE857_31615 [Nocardiopsis exhalans]